MDNQTVNKLQDRINALKRTKVERRYALVTVESPFTIEMGGVEIEGVPRLNTYTPSAGDRVAVDVRGQDLLVLGEPV
jgi:hypothetical protein